MFFNDYSNAGSAVITNTGGTTSVAFPGVAGFSGYATAASSRINNIGGSTQFTGNASAGSATITTDGGIYGVGQTFFTDNATAANGNFLVNGTVLVEGSYGQIDFQGKSTAADAIITANGSTVVTQYGFGGSIYFVIESSAGNASITLDGTKVKNGIGGLLEFRHNSRAENSILIARGGATGPRGGGRIYFQEDSSGDRATIKVYGNGKLDMSLSNQPGTAVGSIAGNGNIFLGPVALAVGTNDRSTTFSGPIQDGGFNGGIGGSLIKVGNGTLTLSGANTYTGGTTIYSGALVVNNLAGSATGKGPVEVQAGRLSGTGRIAGAVVIGSGNGPGALISPGTSASRIGTLTIGRKLTFSSDGTYRIQVDTDSSTADLIVARNVAISNSAQFSLSNIGSAIASFGTTFMVISNASPNSIIGNFANLPEGAVFTRDGNDYRVSYMGGDGNDLTITVVR
jgi:fibronectin-binding autotransporter adhesin